MNRIVFAPAAIAAAEFDMTPDQWRRKLALRAQVVRSINAQNTTGKPKKHGRKTAQKGMTQAQARAVGNAMRSMLR